MKTYASIVVLLLLLILAVCSGGEFNRADTTGSMRHGDARFDRAYFVQELGIPSAASCSSLTRQEAYRLCYQTSDDKLCATNDGTNWDCVSFADMMAEGIDTDSDDTMEVYVSSDVIYLDSDDDGTAEGSLDASGNLSALSIANTCIASEYATAGDGTYADAYTGWHTAASDGSCSVMVFSGGAFEYDADATMNIEDGVFWLLDDGQIFFKDEGLRPGNEFSVIGIGGGYTEGADESINDGDRLVFEGGTNQTGYAIQCEDTSCLNWRFQNVTILGDQASGGSYPTADVLGLNLAFVKGFSMRDVQVKEWSGVAVAAQCDVDGDGTHDGGSNLEDLTMNGVRIANSSTVSTRVGTGLLWNCNAVEAELSGVHIARFDVLEQFGEAAAAANIQPASIWHHGMGYGDAESYRIMAYSGENITYDGIRFEANSNVPLFASALVDSDGNGTSNDCEITPIYATGVQLAQGDDDELYEDPCGAWHVTDIAVAGGYPPTESYAWAEPQGMGYQSGGNRSLIWDGSIEAWDDANTPSKWTVVGDASQNAYDWDSSETTNVAQNSTAAYVWEGAYSARVGTSGATASSEGIAAESIAVDTTKPYTLVARVKGSDGNSRLEVAVRTCTSSACTHSGDYIGDGTNDIIATPSDSTADWSYVSGRRAFLYSGTWTPGTSWYTVVLPFKLSESYSITHIRVSLTATGSTGSTDRRVYVDAVELYEGLVPTEFHGRAIIDSGDQTIYGHLQVESDGLTNVAMSATGGTGESGDCYSGWEDDCDSANQICWFAHGKCFDISGQININQDATWILGCGTTINPDATATSPAITMKAYSSLQGCKANKDSGAEPSLVSWAGEAGKVAIEVENAQVEIKNVTVRTTTDTTTTGIQVLEAADDVLFDHVTLEGDFDTAGLHIQGGDYGTYRNVRLRDGTATGTSLWIEGAIDATFYKLQSDWGDVGMLVDQASDDSANDSRVVMYHPVFDESGTTGIYVKSTRSDLLVFGGHIENYTTSVLVDLTGHPSDGNGYALLTGTNFASAVAIDTTAIRNDYLTCRDCNYAGTVGTDYDGDATVDVSWDGTDTHQPDLEVDGSLNIDGSIDIASDGTEDYKKRICGTVSIDPPSIAASASGTATGTLTGVATGWACFMSPNADWNDDLIPKYVRVSATDTVQVGFYLASAGTNPTDAAAQNIYVCCSEP